MKKFFFIILLSLLSISLCFGQVASKPYLLQVWQKASGDTSYVKHLYAGWCVNNTYQVNQKKFVFPYNFRLGLKSIFPLFAGSNLHIRLAKNMTSDTSLIIANVFWEKNWQYLGLKTGYFPTLIASLHKGDPFTHNFWPTSFNLMPGSAAGAGLSFFTNSPLTINTGAFYNQQNKKLQTEAGLFFKSKTFKIKIDGRVMKYNDKYTKMGVITFEDKNIYLNSFWTDSTLSFFGELNYFHLHGINISPYLDLNYNQLWKKLELLQAGVTIKYKFKNTAVFYWGVCYHQTQNYPQKRRKEIRLFTYIRI